VPGSNSQVETGNANRRPTNGLPGRLDLLEVSLACFFWVWLGGQPSQPSSFSGGKTRFIAEWIYLVRAFIEKLSKARNENEAYSFVCAWLTNRDRLDEPGLR